MISRNKGQEKLLQLCYLYLFYLPYELRPNPDELWIQIFGTPELDDPFFRQVYDGFIKYFDLAYAKIVPHLRGWEFERLSLIDQAILILGFVERYCLDLPKPVVINVFVKLSKEYSAEDETYRFINGVFEQLL